ncbi:somatostatin receptor type 2-like [Ptychodera flava]|uniref:somatostatin receptor type 2-like n=1 Tax=Ptychodera flava TaxID=63121 RepID=UPI00396A5CA4
MEPSLASGEMVSPRYAFSPSNLSTNDIVPVVNSTYYPDGNASAAEYHLGRYDIYVPIVYGVVFVPGVIGNCLAIYLICRFAKLKSVPNIFILNLALADMLFMFGIPFLAYALASPTWNLGTAMCKIVLSIDGLNQVTGVLFLTVMSFDRYLAVVHPMKTRTLRTPRRAKIVSLFVWVVSGLFILPMWLYSQVLQKPNGDCRCTMDLPSYFGREHFVVYTFTVAFALPVSIILVFYSLITLNLMRSRAPGPKKKKRKSSQKVIKMVALYVVIFVVCWLPFYVIQFVYVFHMDPARPPSRAMFALYLTSICLSYANSAINPYILTLSAGSHRQNLKRVWKKLSIGSNPPSTRQADTANYMTRDSSPSKSTFRAGSRSPLACESSKKRATDRSRIANGHTESKIAATTAKHDSVQV